MRDFFDPDLERFKKRYDAGEKFPSDFIEMGLTEHQNKRDAQKDPFKAAAKRKARMAQYNLRPDVKEKKNARRREQRAKEAAAREASGLALKPQPEFHGHS